MSDKKDYDLKDAYSVSTPEDNKALYRDWAETYDTNFAEQRGYNYPSHIAKLYQHHQNTSDTPILDVGAGTGLVGQALSLVTGNDMDGIDISPEMLEKSRDKKVYRALIETDLTKSLDIKPESYGCIVSVGTFTHGHVGPPTLRELIRVAKPNALFLIGINITAFDKYGFGSYYALLQAEGLISALRFAKARYYNDADDDHAGDIGLTAIFRKT